MLVCCIDISAVTARERWLSSTFPRLPKTRGQKHIPSNVPLHEYKAHEKFELVVGPHIFPETSLFEVVYNFPNDQVAHTPTSGFATVELLTMVQEAAASNPELNFILEQISTQPDYDAHLQRLGHIIRTMFPNYATTSVPSTPSPTRTWDFVVEFKDKPLDRWIFPRGAVRLGQ